MLSTILADNCSFGRRVEQPLEQRAIIVMVTQSHAIEAAAGILFVCSSLVKVILQKFDFREKLLIGKSMDSSSKQKQQQSKQSEEFNGQAGSSINGQVTVSEPNKQAKPNLSVWYCSSRWLMAHHDPTANIQTSSSHLVLADLHQDNEYSLALVDFKQQQQSLGSSNEDLSSDNRSSSDNLKLPFDCRLRVYRGQQLVYSHFLDDLPAGLLSTSCRSLINATVNYKTPMQKLHQQQAPTSNSQYNFCEPNLALPINDDIYFYRRLKPAQIISLEDSPALLESMDRAEVEAWQTVKQQDNECNLSTLADLLRQLRDANGPESLSSHSINFLALSSESERRRYIATWRLKKRPAPPPQSAAGLKKTVGSGSSFGEQLSSMDTICCACSQRGYPFNSNYSSSLSSASKEFDGRQTTFESAPFLNEFLLKTQAQNQQPKSINQTMSNQLTNQLDMSLAIGTEDRHVLVYDLTVRPAQLQRHYRLPATPDHLLMESASPGAPTISSSFIYSKNDDDLDAGGLVCPLLASCRDNRIYKLTAGKCRVRELVFLKCQVVQMSWLDGEHESLNQQQQHSTSIKTYPKFVVATSDRRFQCFGSESGECKWMVQLEMPITCLVSLPPSQSQGSTQDMNLVGVGSQANRIDFYTSSNGLIVDSIYFSSFDYPQAIVFGRFGREDNCLISITKLGHLLIFVLKRQAKFAHGQCLSSASSYATDTLTRALLVNANGGDAALKLTRTKLKLNEPTSVPTAFNLSSSSSLAGATHRPANTTQAISAATPGGSKTNNSDLDSNMEHDCEQHETRQVDIESLLRSKPKMQLPVKSRAFVEQIVQQSQHSKGKTRIKFRANVSIGAKMNDSDSTKHNELCEMLKCALKSM